MSIYLVDVVNGKDTNDGIATPWKTVAKVNSRTFHPGDHIHFRSGQTWHEKLTVLSSGLSGNPITIASYGTGPKPILDEDHARYPAIQVSGKFHILIKSLQIQNTTNAGILVKGGGDVRIESVDFKNTKALGIMVDAATGCTLYANTLALDSGFVMNGSFIFVRKSIGAINLSYNRATLHAALGTSNGIFIHDTDNALIHHNTFTAGTTGIGVNALNRNVSGVQIYQNAVYATDGSHGDGEAIEFTGDENYTVQGIMRHNLVHKGANSGYAGVHTQDCLVYGNIALGWIKNAFHWTSHCLNTKLYNNTCWDVGYGFLFDPDCSADVRNNIVMACSERGIGAGTGAAVKEDYNIFWKCGPNNIPRGAHTQMTDPMLVKYPPTVVGDCRLKAGSPAMGSGADLGSTCDSAFDPASANFPYTLIPHSGNWSRGAFTY